MIVNRRKHTHLRLKRYLFNDTKMFFHLDLFSVVLFQTDDLTVFCCTIFSLKFNFPLFLLFFISLYTGVSHRGDSASTTGLRTLRHKVQSGELAHDVLRKNDLIRMFRFGRIAFGGIAAPCPGLSVARLDSERTRSSIPGVILN